MPSTLNYIDQSERRFVEPVYATSLIGTLWTTDAVLEGDAATYQDPEYGSLRLSDGITAELAYNIYSDLNDVPSQFSITTDSENTDYIKSFMWVRPTENCTIRVRTILHKVELDSLTNEFMLSTVPEDVYNSAEGVHRIEIGASDQPKWHLIRSVPIQIPDEGQFSIGFRLTVEYDTPLAIGVLNVSRPTIIRVHAFLDNKFLTSMSRVMPRVFLSQDIADFTKAEVTYPMMRLIDISTVDADSIMYKFDDIEYMDISEGFDPALSDTYSTLVAPTYADSATLEWLAQFRGRNLIVTYEPSTEGEEWELFILDESLLDGADVVGASSVATTGFSGGIEAYFKWQVETGYYGHNAGTLSAMISAIQLLLSGTKTVGYTYTANSIHFTTSIGETFGGEDLTVGDPSPYILEIVEPARPLGMVVTHELIS